MNKILTLILNYTMNSLEKLSLKPNLLFNNNSNNNCNSSYSPTNYNFKGKSQSKTSGRKEFKQHKQEIVGFMALNSNNSNFRDKNRFFRTIRIDLSYKGNSFSSSNWTIHNLLRSVLNHNKINKILTSTCWLTTHNNNSSNCNFLHHNSNNNKVFKPKVESKFKFELWLHTKREYYLAFRCKANKKWGLWAAIYSNKTFNKNRSLEEYKVPQLNFLQLAPISCSSIRDSIMKFRHRSFMRHLGRPIKFKSSFWRKKGNKRLNGKTPCLKVLLRIKSWKELGIW